MPHIVNTNMQTIFYLNESYSAYYHNNYAIYHHGNQITIKWRITILFAVEIGGKK